MADYTVNTLYDMINVCNEISSEEYTDVETNIYIEKDIDLNDYSEYWVITQTLFKITTRLDNQKITIHGKGKDTINGTPHTIRNIYLSSGFIFDIIPYSTETGSSNDTPLTNRTFIINDLNIECLIHINSVDTNGPIGIFNCDNNVKNLYYKIGFSNSFNNCIFNIKSYKSKSGSIGEQRTSMFRCYNQNIYIYFNGCIFNNEHRKLVEVSTYEHFSLIDNGANNASNVILRHCQINVRLFILDNSTASNTADMYITSCTLFNCFVRLTLEANTSKNPFHLLNAGIKSENSYVIIKPPANPNTTFFTTQANLVIQCYSYYSSCNFYVSEIDDISDLISLNVSSNYKKVDPVNAKNAEYLTINVPFIVKT